MNRRTLSLAKGLSTGSPVNSRASLARLIRRREPHGEFSYIGPACCVSFRRKCTGWNAHASKGIADVFG
jgi:hypothetical protein